MLFFFFFAGQYRRFLFGVGSWAGTSPPARGWESRGSTEYFYAWSHYFSPEISKYRPSRRQNGTPCNHIRTDRFDELFPRVLRNWRATMIWVERIRDEKEKKPVRRPTGRRARPGPIVRWNDGYAVTWLWIGFMFSDTTDWNTKIIFIIIFFNFVYPIMLSVQCEQCVHVWSDTVEQRKIWRRCTRRTTRTWVDHFYSIINKEKKKLLWIGILRLPGRLEGSLERSWSIGPSVCRSILEKRLG